MKGCRSSENKMNMHCRIHSERLSVYKSGGVVSVAWEIVVQTTFKKNSFIYLSENRNTKYKIWFNIFQEWLKINQEVFYSNYIYKLINN